MAHVGLDSDPAAWPGTPPSALPRSSTDANHDPSSPPAPRSWTSSSPEPNPSRVGRHRRPGSMAHQDLLAHMQHRTGGVSGKAPTRFIRNYASALLPGGRSG